MTAKSTLIRRKNLAVIISTILWAAILLQTASDFTKYPVSDLRNRVTGARKLAAGINPYLRPDTVLPESYRAYSPTSISPAELLLYWPLRNLSYEMQRRIYFGVDWLLVGLCFLGLLRIASDWPSQATLFLLISIFFLADNSLRLHFARGQTYVLLLALAIVAANGMRSSNPGWLAPCALALLVLFRPTYVVAVASMLLGGYWRLPKRAIALVFVLAAMVLAVTGLKPAFEYWRFVLEESHGHISLATGHYAFSSASHAVIEGVDSGRFLRFQGYVEDQTFLGLMGRIGRFREMMLHHQSLIASMNFGLIAICPAAGLLVAWRARTATNWYVKASWAFLLPFDIETFGPQRYPYADVLLLLPAALMALALLERRAESYNQTLNRLALLAAASALLSRIPAGPIALITTLKFLIILFLLNVVCILEIVRSKKNPEALEQIKSVHSAKAD